MQPILIQRQAMFIALMASITIFGLLPIYQVEAINDKYDINVEVNCIDYCEADWKMHWACAIGYNFSGLCVLPENYERGSIDDQTKCRLVGFCYNRAEDDANRAACNEVREKAVKDCAPNRIKESSYFCDSADVWGYECETG